MKKVTLSYILLLALLVIACSAAPVTAPTLDSSSVQSTALVAAFTLVARTQAALPTNTALPPTETSTSTPLPTDTPAPLPTLDTLATPTVILLPTDLPTSTSQPVAAGAVACNQQLVSWKGDTSNFVMLNETTSPKAKIQLLVTVTTKMGDCGWLKVNGNSFSGPAGTYSATAFVNGTPNFRVSGAFFIQGGNWKIIVRNTGIVAKGGCYPTC
jgi:hypothetical protein